MFSQLQKHYQWMNKKRDRIIETKHIERVILFTLENACLISWLHDGSLFLDPKAASYLYLSPVKKRNKTKVLRNFQDSLLLSFHFCVVTYKKSGIGGGLFGFSSNWAEVGVEKHAEDRDEDSCDVTRSERIVEESVTKCEHQTRFEMSQHLVCHWRCLSNH